MKGNFHTHTYRCKHASGKEEDYVKAAIANGFSELGFSDHGPFPDKDYGLRMDFSELPEYVSEIERLDKVYGDRIKLFKGLEVEYHPKYSGYYKELISELGIEYLVLGEHTYTVSGGTMKNIAFAESTKEYIEYAEGIAEGVETGCFAFIAHPDIMFRNNFSWDRNCDKACDIILSAAEKYSVPLEFNVNGLRRGFCSFPDGIRYQYPHERFWKQISGSSQKVIIGADCHIPEQLNDAYITMAEKMCTDLKLNLIERVENIK